MDWFPVAGKTFIVLGLARSGLSTIEWLRRQGAHVLAFDDSAENREQVHRMGVDVFSLESISSLGQVFSGVSAVVQSPGVPLYYPKPHPVTEAALAQGIPIISDILLFKRAHPENRIIGVTGTNGKSTTTALIGHILRQCGFEVAVGGNIGVPALALPELSKEGIYVIEFSSYQLDLVDNLGLDAAVWLNISEDHLDRHGTMERYVQAKSLIFSGKSRSKIAIIGIDDPHSLAIYEGLQKTEQVRVIPVSITQTIRGGIYLDNSFLVDDWSCCSTPSSSEPSLDCHDFPTLLGRHNWQNAAMAYAFARSWGCSVGDIVKALKTFPGLPHRQEHIATIQGVRFINDSKATNADAAAKALATFDEIFWIAGGQPKQDGIGSLPSFFPKIKQAFLIGQAQDEFAEVLEGKIPFQRCASLEEATRQAFNQAKTYLKEDGAVNPVVLLSPACASFDQFRDFEHRGEVFRLAVHSLVLSKK